jgi:hypothetical protein
MLAVIYLPLLEPIFYTHELPLRDWLYIAPLALVPSIVAEIGKAVFSRLARRAAVTQ